MLLSIVLVYLPLATLHAVPVSDDGFTSDLLDGELPARVAVGRMLAKGEAPTWTDGIDGGYPLLASGATEPLSLALFTLLPPAAALDLYLLALLAVAGLGAYALARQLGARPVGAMLTGTAFAHSGFVVCQLRHPAELSCAVWLPVGLVLLERAVAAARAGPRRPLLGALALFGLVFGEQALCGFPQTAYIAALAYGCWMLVRAALLPCRWPRRLELFGLFALAGLGGAAVGAVGLWPLARLGAASDRAAGVTSAMVQRFAYWLPQLSSFFVPYLHGDVSSGTFHGHGIFWEDYGYLGALVVPLALGSLAGARRRQAWLLWALALVALVLVVGPATPLFPLAFRVVPGMKTFRFPQRFLVVTELCLATLAGLGLTALEEWLERLHRAGRLRLRAVVPVLVLALLSFADESFFNARQNALDDASRWLDEPAVLQRLPKGEPYRVYTPGWMGLHERAFQASRGWNGDLGPLREVRSFAQPDLNLLWGLQTVDGYAGITPRWVVDMVGDHNRPGLLERSYHFGPGGTLETTPLFYRLLALNDVRFLLTPELVMDAGARLFTVDGPVRVYELTSRLPRARLVPAARRTSGRAQALQLLASASFNPSRELLLDGAAPAEPEGGTGTARIEGRSSTSVTVRTRANGPAWLVLAESWFPGWTATIDGQPALLLRANLSQRAVPVPGGEHVVRFQLRSRPVRLGLAVTLAAAALLALVAIGFRRQRAQPPAPGLDS